MASAAPKPPVSKGKEIRIVSHSMLFYWWPVWLTCLLFGMLTLLFGDQKLVTVPEGTVAASKLDLTNPNLRPEIRGHRDAYVLPEGKSIPSDPHDNHLTQPHLHVAAGPRPGVLFGIVLLLVVAITNVPMRGVWAVVAVVLLFIAFVVLASLGFLDSLLTRLSYLDVRINVGGYFFIGGVLFFLWLFVLLVLDRRVYVVFTPRQIRVRLESGAAEMAYDTASMTVQHSRSQPFLHFILGLGAGDLVVRTTGAQAHQFDLPNVLSVGRRAREVQALLRLR